MRYEVKTSEILDDTRTELFHIDNLMNLSTTKIVSFMDTVIALKSSNKANMNCKTEMKTLQKCRPKIFFSSHYLR